METKMEALTKEKEEAVQTAYNRCMMVCTDKFLISKLKTCLEFLKNNTPVSEARKRAFECHRYARALKEQKRIFLARACGHAIATIHVKEHLQACLYYLEKYERAMAGYERYGNRVSVTKI
ncbi:MAG: hypothetical protein FWH42_01595 [Dehalococcoidia bacterium]|nr:hypothetical protein [Dehalococcoidia bacterium]